MSSAPKGRSNLSDLLSNSHNNTLMSNSEPLPTDSDDLQEVFIDGTRSFGYRKAAFDELRKQNKDLAREAITNLCRSYEQSNSKDLLSFIIFLLDYGKLDIFEKFECVLMLHDSKHKNVRDYWIAILRDFIKQDSTLRPSIAFYIDILRYLIDGDFEPRIIEFIKWFCHSSSCLTPFIYRNIVSIHRESIAPEDSNFATPRRASKLYIDCLYQTFFNGPIDNQHRILSAQYLLNNKLDVSNVESSLVSIFSETSNPHNIRADAADTLLKLGSSESRALAIKVMSELGRDLTQLPTLTANRENVHVFDESTTKFLLTLGGNKIATISQDGSERIQTLEDIAELIRKLPRYNENQDSINSSLARIRIDQVLYPGSQTLNTIFVRIWQVIDGHKNKELLMERLIDELIDMADTCSTGHANRLINVFSGIDGFFMKMNWRDQIQSNITGRLTARANVAIDREERNRLAELGIQASEQQLAIIDAKFRENVMEEMLNTDIEDRVHWNRFLRDVIAGLREELYNEFVVAGHVIRDDFDLYFRQGMVFYETGERE